MGFGADLDRGALTDPDRDTLGEGLVDVAGLDGTAVALLTGPGDADGTLPQAASINDPAVSVRLVKTNEWVVRSDMRVFLQTCDDRLAGDRPSTSLVTGPDRA